MLKIRNKTPKRRERKSDLKESETILNLSPELMGKVRD
jgi:hypothetical protein